MVPAIVAGSCSSRHHRRRAQKHVAGVAKNCHFNREKSGKSRGNQSIEQLNKSIHLRGRMNGNILVNKPNILETYWSIHIVEPNKYQPPGGWLPRHHHDDVPVDHALTIPWLSIHVSVRKKKWKNETHPRYPRFLRWYPSYSWTGFTTFIIHRPSSVLLVTSLVKPVLVALKNFEALKKYWRNENISGWWYTPLKNHGLCQLGWLFHSQLFLESLIKFHGSSHHQPISVLEKCSCFLKTNRPSKHFLVLSNPHFSSLWLSPSSITWKAIQLFHEEQVHVHLPSGNLT